VLLPDTATVAPPLVGHTVPVSKRPGLRSIGLRTRLTLLFSLTALVASAGLAVVTYVVARSNLVDQRVEVSKRQAFVNAQTVKDQLLTNNPKIGEYIQTRLRTETGGGAILLLPGRDPIASDARFQTESLPAELQTVVAAHENATQRFSFDGQPFIAVGLYITAGSAQYYEVFPLVETDRTLSTIAAVLAIGAGAIVALAALLGWWTSRRLLRPVSRVATAAQNLASGGLDTRMPPETDADLDRVARSFNEMADAVQARIEREARFASDVSHELRSPITALTAAVEVLDGRRDDLPERSRQALDVVVGQVRRFDQMVMDLLELSRIDGGSTELHRDDVQLGDLISRIAHRYGFADVPIEVDADLPQRLRVDKVRFERIMANLLDNAKEHAGGPVLVRVEPNGRHGMVLTVEDAGPGVARGERARIFERFARGSAARHRIGTGLGLALVAEHANAHGGEAWVEDRPGGGARFKVSFAEVM
jgi:two-component system sensor histidine kinase MtrB